MIRLMRIMEDSLNVAHLAELDVKLAEPHWTAAKALAWLTDSGFDAAPLNEPEVNRVVVAKTLQASDRPVAEQAIPLDATLLVSADLSLAQGITRLATRPFYFVLQADRLGGVVTRADLQRPAVAMIVFSTILAAETAMSALIEQRLDVAWSNQLKPSDWGKVDAIHQSRLRHNTEVTPLECLMLHQRLDLLKACPGLLAELSFNANRFRSWKQQLTRLRDTLAHGGGLLDAQPDPERAIGLFEAVRSFADRLWTVAELR